jgi:lipopolysaccharide/colanic/teichoic acid biosynthesis glycosyltransferase
MKTTAAHAQAQTINSQNFAAGNAFGNSQVHSGGGQKLLRIVATPYLQVLLSLLISIFLVGLASFFFADSALSSEDATINLMFASFLTILSALTLAAFTHSPLPYGLFYTFIVNSAFFLIGLMTLIAFHGHVGHVDVVAYYVLSTMILGFTVWLSERNTKYTFHQILNSKLYSFKRSDKVSVIGLDNPNNIPAEKIDGIIVDFSQDITPEWERYLAQSSLNGVKIYNLVELIEAIDGRLPFEQAGQIAVNWRDGFAFYVPLKRILDLAFALVILPVFIVVIAIAAILVRLDSPGSAFFVQQRVGYKGRKFNIYKLRTMKSRGIFTENADFTHENDPRITRIGKILRKTRIDEFPQIINIIKGEMSWIGPRPESAPLAEWYEREIPFYAYRHLVRPGISGWAAVHQGNVAEIDAAKIKLMYDLYYIKNFSFALDFMIVLRTFFVMLTGFGSR